MKKTLLLISILITSFAFPQSTSMGNVIINKGGKGDPTSVKTINGQSIEGVGNVVVSGEANQNIFIPTLATDFTSPNPSNIGKIWELQTDIDLGGAVIDLSTYNITLKDGGGKLTNFTSIDLGSFQVENGEDSVFFDQSGTIAGTTIGTTYVSWFGLNANADLIVDANVNGALPDHIAIQNAISVLAKDNAKLEFPNNAYMMQGDGTNPDYIYDPVYTGNGNVDQHEDEDPYIGVSQFFNFEEFTNLTIIGNGSRIIANPNQSNIVNNQGFYFKFCENTEIRDLKYDGSALYRDPYHSDASKFNSQNGFSFRACKNTSLFKLTAINCVMDGFYFGAFNINNPLVVNYGYNAYLEECYSEYNYRQGISVVNFHYIVIRDSYFGETGRLISLVNGRNLVTEPGSNIDLEHGQIPTGGPDRGQKQSKVINNVLKNAHGAGLNIQWGSYDILVSGNTFIDELVYSPADVEGLTCNNTIENNNFENSSFLSHAGGERIIGNKFFIDKPNSRTRTVLQIYDEDNNYNVTKRARQSVVEGNYVFVDLESDNFVANDTLIVGKVGVSTKQNGVFSNNRFINCIGNKGVGSSTNETIAKLTGINTMFNNNWAITDGAKIKYAGKKFGKIFGENTTEIKLTDHTNTIDDLYSYDKVYDGGSRGVTSDAPTVGGVENYTEINVGADYYDTTTNTMKYWNGTTFN